MTEIKFDSLSEDYITNTFLFGKTRYFVKMKYGRLKYKELISKALDNQDYLEADRLTKEYNCSKSINYN